jgi:hydroxypyruvate reductase
MNTDIREDLLVMRQAALQAVNPSLAVRRYLSLKQESDGRLMLRSGEARWQLQPEQRLFVVAVGKAAIPMIQAAVDILGKYLHHGIVITKYEHATGVRLPEKIRVVEAGHPVPDQQGLNGAQAVAQMVAAAGPQDQILLLLSGGASALVPLPAQGISLQDVQQLTELLLRSGATIEELNAVRKHIDQLKGGQLARLSAPAPLSCLILSDVIGDRLDVIASGPTAPDPSTFDDAWDVLARRNLLQAAPPSVLARLRAGKSGDVPETPKAGDPIFSQVVNTVIGSNRQAALAAVQAARDYGYNTLLLTTFLEGEAREVGLMLAGLAKGIRIHGDPLATPACLVLGGETTVTVRGKGRGGRNQELALAAALALDGLPGVALMSLATDGTDGPTDAAGGLVDGSTLQRARHAGFDPLNELQANNAYPLLQAAGALMQTGPTGTNVNDLVVILVRA